MPKSSLVVHGAAVGLKALPNLTFDPEVSYTYCRLCGAVFQDPDTINRRDWSFKHARKHSYRQHRLLQLSGRWLTPEAAYVLAAFGVVPVSDMVLDDEVADALAKSSPTPVEDVCHITR